MMTLWQDAKEILKESMPVSSYCLWIEPLKCIGRQTDAVELGGPDRFFCTWVAENYLNTIRQAFEKSGAGEVTVRFSVDPSAQSMPARVPESRPPAGEQMRLPAMPLRCVNTKALHPRYTFDEFMVGECNELAKNACESLANGNTDLGRYLYIGGGTGHGKSHLSHAVAHHVINYFPETRLHYLTARQLTIELVRALKHNAMDRFKEKFHDHCDILLLDDVHTLTGRMKTQEELEAVLDVLMETGKRIIFTGTIPPKDIPDMDNRVRSRLSAGLITQLNAPDNQTLVRIIRHKAKSKNLQLSEELVDYMAEKLTGDIRQVESAIIGLRAKSSLLRKEPDLDLVREVLTGIVSHEKTLTVEIIRDFLAGQFKITVQDLQSRSRKKNIAFPRQVSMYLARKMTNQPLVDIGRAFNRDHSTVVHAIRTIGDNIARNASVRGQVELLSKRLQQKYG